MSMLPNSQEARDVAYQLHPYTNARTHQQAGPLVIERGEGPYVFDASGKRYFEAMAGLWSVGLGFNEKRLVEAAHRQMQALPFYHTFSAKSHGPSIDLAEKLVALAPVPMSKVFFTNSGSEANDTVLKLIAYRSNALGQPQRKKVISRMRAYHGVTIASASLTGLPNNHRSFDLPLPNILHTGSPHFYKDGAPGETEEAFATRRAEELDALIQKEGPDTIAAESNKIGVLGHGFTAGGHPVGSAIALENLKIIEERGLVAHAAELGGYMQAKLRELTSHPLVGEVRGVGMIAALELVLDKQRKTAAATPGAVGGMASRMLQERGVISRNMLDAIAICPPLIVTKGQIDELVAAISGVLDDMKPEVAKLTPA